MQSVNDTPHGVQVAAPPHFSRTTQKKSSGNGDDSTEVSAGGILAAPDYGYPDVQTPAATVGVLSSRHHAGLVEESAISESSICARGYFTQTDRQALKLLGFSSAQCLPPALVIPIYDWRGECVCHVLRPDIPRNGKNGKPVKYEWPQGQSAVLDIAPLTREQIDDPAKPLIITEGAKKADAAASRGLCAINLNGVYGFSGKNLKGGITALADWQNIALNGRAVFIVYDSDVADKTQVETALRRLCALLQAKKAVVKVCYLPEGSDNAKTGLDDFFARGGTVAEMFAFARDLAPIEETQRKRKITAHAEQLATIESEASKAGVPTIEINNRHQADEMSDLAMALEAYNLKTPKLFHAAVGLACVEYSPTGAPFIKPATRESVQDLAGKAARWKRTSERDGISKVAPPRDLCAIYRAAPDNWRGVPPLEGTATAPFFAPDGTLCAQTGYHAAAKTFLALPENFRLPDTTPTLENIAAARRLIGSTLLGEVAFADQASRAHAIAQMILPFVRRLISDQTPLHLWNAPLRGSGKSYAAELCILPFAKPTATPEKGNAEEWRKSLLCELVTGPSHVFLDNVSTLLQSSALDMALSQDTFRDRLTGTGEMVTASTRCVWVATANNATLSEDLVTRSIVIRLDPDCENPEERHFGGDPKIFIRDNRATVCGAIITLVRAWQDAGCPEYSGPAQCRFKDWKNLIGGILQIVEIPGFLENQQEQRDLIGTSVNDEWREFFALWHEKHGANYVTAQELLPLAMEIAGIAAALDKTEGPARARKFMGLLRHRRDRIFNGLKLCEGPKINRQRSYRIENRNIAQQ